MLMKLPHHTEINEIPRSHCSTDIDAITDIQIIPYVPAVQGKDKAKQAAKQLQQVFFLQQPDHYHLTFCLLLQMLQCINGQTKYVHMKQKMRITPK